MSSASDAVVAELGTVSRSGVVLSEARHWLEDGRHVFQSTEFDVYAADEDEHRAVEKFVDALTDYSDFITDLDAADMTRHEAERTLDLLRRFTRAAEAEIATYQRRLFYVNLRRFSRRAESTWRLQSGPPSSSPLQPV